MRRELAHIAEHGGAMLGDQQDVRSDRLANGKLERTAYHGVKILQCSTGPMQTPPRRGRLRQARRPPASCRCWTAAAVWSGPRAAELAQAAEQENRRGDSSR